MGNVHEENISELLSGLFGETPVKFCTCNCLNKNKKLDMFISRESRHSINTHQQMIIVTARYSIELELSEGFYRWIHHNILST